MALPSRRHFDIKSAAEYLDCSVSDLRHYLDEDLLRCAFPATALEAVDAFDSEKLPQELRAKIDQLPDAPDQDDLAKIRRRIPEVCRCPEFLYVNSHYRKTVLTARNELRRAIYYFESFEGQPLNIWLDGSLNYLWAERGEDGELRGTVLPREEIDRFAPKTKTKAKRKTNRNEKTVEPKPVYSAPSEKPNEQSLIIVEYANQYVQEVGKIPKPKAFGKYLEEHAKKYGFRIRSDKEIRTPGSDFSEKDKYDFNGYGMSERSLGRALRRYYVEDETAN